MMNFLDLSAASEEERRLIREILSDTSVINIAEPYATNQNQQQQQQQYRHIAKHQQQQASSCLAQTGAPPTATTTTTQTTTPATPAALKTSPLQTTATTTATTTTTSTKLPLQNGANQRDSPPTPTSNHHNVNIPNNLSANTSAVVAPTTATQHQQQLNNIYMTSTQPAPAYAIPPHVTAFAAPPPPHHHHHHVYSGPPIFQPYQYLIPYNIPPQCVPYVIPPNTVVPTQTRQQVPPQLQQPHQHHHLHQPQQQQQQQQPHQQQPQQSRPPNATTTTTNTQMHSRFRNIPHHTTQQQQPNQQQHRQRQQHHNHNHNHNHQSQPLAQHHNNNQLQQQPQSQIKPQSKPSQPEQLPHPQHQDHQKPINSISNQQQTQQEPLQESHQEPEQQEIRVEVQKEIQNGREQIDKEESDKIKPEQNQIVTSNEDSPRATATNNNISNNVTAIQTESWSSSKSWADLFKRGANAELLDGDEHNNTNNSDTSENVDNVKSQSSSSSSIITSTTTNNINSTASCHTISATSSSKELRSQDAAKRAMDKMALRFAQKINTISLKHSLPFIKPRGFINKGNGCYINATLQALIACPPFYNLMKEIGDLRGFRREKSCTPILDSFAELFLNFPPIDVIKRNKQLNQQQQQPDQKLHIDNLQAESIEPRCIYNVLGLIKSECLKGAQEDAEEFLSSVLNGLHEEMIGLSEVLQPFKDTATNQQNGTSTTTSTGSNTTAFTNTNTDVEDSNDDISNDNHQWREVGPKNRSLPIRSAKVINTPIQEIFGGSSFSIRQAGKDRCGHQSPFFDLQLDISGDNVKSVQDAIKSFTAPEIIHDFYCSKTKQKLDAQRRTSLDQLPPILILHLKQFIYTQDHGLKKLIKKIEYPIDFELPDSCLHEKNSSSSIADKNSRTSRSYKLLAVVYHEGKEAVKGHYLTDVYHIGSSQWIRCDDSNLKVINSPRIENPDSSRTPYLLFYRRLNTLRPGSHDSKKKN